jgi:tight adherence protein C
LGALGTVLLSYLAAGLFGAAVAVVAWALWPHKLIAEAGEEGAESQRPVDVARRVVFKRMAPFSMPLLSEKRESLLKQRLLMMGAPDLRPVDIITMQILCTILFTVLAGMMLHLVGETLLYAFLGAALGAGLPLIWMRDQIKRRHLEIGRSMPFNLDLLTLSVEAGLDFGGAVATVVSRGIPGALTEELGIMLREIRMGKTREESLRNLADRVRFPPLTQFVSNLIQADRMGTSLGKILRIQSSQLRIARTQRAEKLANEAPVKMLFPLIFCIFPTVFMILFGPIVYQFMDGGP